ncbi:MAG TPA: hypothetical protein VE932_07620, partial [Patescibacteria group bacterium]|nr:hypothetical protein [Patescibacteria group bacterium]
MVVIELARCAGDDRAHAALVRDLRRGRDARETSRGVAAPPGAARQRRHQTTQLPRIDRLEDMLVKAGLQQALAIVAAAVRRHRDRRGVG